jgi:glycerol-3-phosphate O-acyltransferase / dihydroxyacetone phosphate acyltransferase
MFITINHPSAFMDPMTFSWVVFYPRTRYMARGDAFKKGLANAVLQSMGIVPIYRMRDGGIENVRKNLDSFKVAYDLLDKKQKIMVFAEGICVQERRLRPIQKGTAKMAFNYLDKGGHDNLKIMPVGLHYSTPSKFRGDVYVEVGEPILVKDYYEAYKQQPAQTIVKLTAAIEEKMSELVPGLAHKENDLLIEQLQPILKEQFLEENKLNVKDLEQHHKYWQFISDRLNQLTERDPAQMETFRNGVDTYSKQLQQTRIEDNVVRNAAENKKTITFINFILLVIGFPFYLMGVILNRPSYYLGQKIARKTSNGKEFFASVSFGSWALLTQLFFLIELIILWVTFHNFYILLFYSALKIGTAIIGLHYSPFKKEMLSGFRLKKLKSSNPGLYQTLINQRNNILGFIGDFH